MVARFGYLNAHLFDLARNVRERGRRGRPSEAELARVHAWFDARELAVDEAIRDQPGGEAGGHNLLLIQVEAAHREAVLSELCAEVSEPHRFLLLLAG